MFNISFIYDTYHIINTTMTPIIPTPSPPITIYHVILFGASSDFEPEMNQEIHMTNTAYIIIKFSFQIVFILNI